MTSVYIIQAQDTNNYKIGISDNPQSRLESLQTAHYKKLSIIHQRAFESRYMALITEEELHTQYKEFNTLGEWFYLDSNQVQTIIESLNQDVTEVLLLKARIKELEKAVKQNPQPQPQQTAPKQKRQIGFRMSRDDLIDTILDNVYSVGDKIPSKRTLVNTNNRNETKVYESTMKDLKQMGVVEFQRGKGYFLAVDYNTALSILES